MTNSGDYRDPALSPEVRVELLLAAMTLDEKIGQMCQYVALPEPASHGNNDEVVGYTPGLEEQARLIRSARVGSFLKVPGQRAANELQRFAEESRLGIPLLIATDAIHGHAMDLEVSTVFPSPIGLAAGFDPGLVERVAASTAQALRATGFHWNFSPNLDVVLDARWGRCGETFGEDPLLVSELGAAMVRGYQGTSWGSHSVLACAKHLVAGGVAENGLNGAPADVSERSLREVFFPPFIRAVAQGVGSAMPAHNEVNGVPCHGDAHLLTTLLRENWGFEGFVVSDWNDIAGLHTTHRVAETRRDADRIAVQAGIDMHMHGGQFFDNVKSLVEAGELSVERIDAAARRILLAKFRLGLFEEPFTDAERAASVVLSDPERSLSLEASRRSLVLLKNQAKILPFRVEQRLLLGGPRAFDQALLGDWAREQPSENCPTLFHALQRLTPNGRGVACSASITDAEIAATVDAARGVEAVVLALGENSLRRDPARTSGENIDRATLELPGRQLELARAVIATGVPVVLVLINGGPIASAAFDSVAAIVEAFEPGDHGAIAIAEVLLGFTNPSGKLPLTVPRSVGHLRSHQRARPSVHHRARFHAAPSEPYFAFGHGLSYTEWRYRTMRLEHVTKRRVRVEIELENSGERSGEEVVLLYLQDLYAQVTVPLRKLVAFRRVALAAGETRTLDFELGENAFELLDARLERVFEPGRFRLIVGDELLHVEFELD